MSQKMQIEGTKKKIIKYKSFKQFGNEGYHSSKRMITANTG